MLCQVLDDSGHALGYPYPDMVHSFESYAQLPEYRVFF